MNNPMENIQNIHEESNEFNWRTYIRDSKALSDTIVKKLDSIAVQLNDSNDTEMKDIKKELEEGIKDRSLRNPLLSMVGMFRPYLSDTERSELNTAIREVGDINPLN